MCVLNIKTASNAFELLQNKAVEEMLKIKAE